jgi:hypothetical protein
MTESGSDDLRKRRAEGAARIGHPSDAANIDDMAEFVNDGALLRNQEQQQEAETFE